MTRTLVRDRILGVPVEVRRIGWYPYHISLGATGPDPAWHIKVASVAWQLLSLWFTYHKAPFVQVWPIVR